jgi:hypothetical protein
MVLFSSEKMSPEKSERVAHPPQEGMMINADTNAALNSSEATIGDVKRILSALKYSDDEWSTTVVGLIDQGIEHHAAFLLLIRSNLVGSAFALVRCIVELFVTGVWFLTCATDAQITKFRNKDKIDPTFGEMAKAIDAACDLDFFHNFKTQVWKALNSYTHTGILQVGRRFDGDKLQPSYTDAEILEMADAATLSLLMLVRPFLARHGHQVAAKEVDQHIGAAKAKYDAKGKKA